MNFVWTDEAIQAVKDLWGKQSAKAIACIIGNPSRSAVCGKAMRLGLSAPRQLPKKVFMYPKPKPKPKPVLPAKPSEDTIIAAPESRPCSLLELTAETCRWPLWTDAAPERLYCGAISPEAEPYCAHHAGIASAR